MNRLFLYTLVLAVMAGCRSTVHNSQGKTLLPALPRPSHWAASVEIAGVNNCHILDKNLFRSAQPTEKGFAELQKMGIKSVLCLRTGWSDVYPARNTMLKCRRISMLAWKISDENIIDALRILNNPAQGPFLVHCLHGSDRTGAVCAAYRIVLQNWSKEEAIAEMTKGGYGYHKMFSNIVNYLNGMDVEKIRSQVQKK